MKRVKSILVMSAIVLGVVGAVAFKPAQSNNLWAIAASDAVYFYISEELNGEALGIHYRCLVSTLATCTISTPSFVVPDAFGRIAKVWATKVIDNAFFQDLAPGQ